MKENHKTWISQKITKEKSLGRASPLTIGMSSGIGGSKVYSSKKEELVLILLSNLYFKLNKIFVNTSKHSASSISYYLPATYFTFYYLNQTCILIFLKRKFLS